MRKRRKQCGLLRSKQIPRSLLKYTNTASGHYLNVLLHLPPALVPSSITERSLLWRQNVISPNQAVHFSVQPSRTWFHQSWPLNYKWRRWLLPERVRQRAEILYTPSRRRRRRHGQSLCLCLCLCISVQPLRCYQREQITDVFKGFLFVSLIFFSFVCCTFMESTFTAQVVNGGVFPCQVPPAP